jgi:acyl carrier protein
MNERQELMELVWSIVQEVSEKPLPDVPPETPIAQMGIDSISVAEIIVRIEDKLGIEIPTSQWMGVRTLNDFIDTIEQALQKKP